MSCSNFKYIATMRREVDRQTRHVVDRTYITTGDAFARVYDIVCVRR